MQLLVTQILDSIRVHSVSADPEWLSLCQISLENQEPPAISRRALRWGLSVPPGYLRLFALRVGCCATFVPTSPRLSSFSQAQSFNGNAGQWVVLRKRLNNVKYVTRRAPRTGRRPCKLVLNASPKSDKSLPTCLIAFLLAALAQAVLRRMALEIIQGGMEVRHLITR